jgi:membrane associated rhomboid family serine protease
VEYCPNPDCPDRRRLGRPAEYRGGVTHCTDCGAALVEQEPSFAPDENTALCHSCAAPVSEGVQLCERCSAAASEEEEATGATDAAPTLDDVLNELPARSLLTPLMILLNVLVFAAMVGSGVSAFDPSIESLLEWGANFGPLTASGEWWRLLTCTFIHIGALHLAVNMYVLWDAGRVVERLVGHAGFLALYIGAGLLGSQASIAWDPLIVSAGASGSVFGVYGALIGVVLRQHKSIPMGPLRKLRNSALAFLIYNFAYGIGEEGIDVAAHAGGLAAGFVMGLLLSQPPTKESLPGRPRRAITASLMALVLVVAVGAALPRDAARFARASDEFARVESVVIDEVNSATERYISDELAHEEFARILESNVLARWRPARERWESFDLTGLPEQLQRRHELMGEYIELRERSWTLLLEDLEGIIDFLQATEKFGTSESFAMNAFVSAVNREPRLTDAAMLEILESDVLAVWNSARESYESLDVTTLSEPGRRHYQNVIEYIRLREQGWELFRAAILESSETKFREFSELDQRAAVVLEELTSAEVDPEFWVGPKRKESEALQERAERVIEELNGTE